MKINWIEKKAKYGYLNLNIFGISFLGEITLLSIGPLTNVAIATTLDPSFLNNLKKHIILGSSTSGIGNVLPNVEFNFYQDPESNYITLVRTNKTSTLFPWETARNSYIPLVNISRFNWNDISLY